MNTYRKLLALIAAAMLISPIVAQATLVTIEPDDFAPGTNLTSFFEGITISAVTVIGAGTREDGMPMYAPVSAAVYSRAVSTHEVAATGDRIFGSLHTSEANLNYGARWGELRGGLCVLSTCAAPSLAQEIGQILRLDFANPTNFVSAIGHFSGGDPTVMFAFDELGQQVASCNEFSLDYQLNTCLSRYLPRVVGDNPLNGWGELNVSSNTRNIKTILIGGVIAEQFIDRIVVEAPEPSAFAVFGLGLLGVLMTSRKRRLLINYR